MVMPMRDSSKTVLSTAKENSLMIMETSMKVIGNLMLDMDKENISVLKQVKQELVLGPMTSNKMLQVVLLLLLHGEK